MRWSRRSRHPHLPDRFFSAMNQPSRFVLLALATALAACQPATDPQATQDAAASQAAAKEAQAQELGKAFDANYGQAKWDLAAALGEELVQLHPDSPVTARIRPQYEEAKAKSLDAR